MQFADLSHANASRRINHRLLQTLSADVAGSLPLPIQRNGFAGTALALSPVSMTEIGWLSVSRSVSVIRSTLKETGPR